MLNKIYKIILSYIIILSFVSINFISAFSNNSETEKNSIGNNNYNNFLEDNSLLAYWNLNEGSGIIAHDYSGHGLDGIIHGTTWTNGYSEYALNFDGELDYILLDDHSEELAFNKTDDYKISAWIKTVSNKAGVIFMINGSTEPPNMPYFYIKIIENGIIEMKVQASDVCQIIINSSKSYNDNKWHFIEGIYHGSEQYSSMDLFIDKNYITSSSAWLCKMYNYYFTRTRIGMNSFNSQESFKGLIDEIKINKKPNQNNPPNTPIISGPNSGTINEVYNYTFTISDPDNDELYLKVDWDDNTNTSWLGPYNTNEDIILSHSWSNENNYEIKAQTRDNFDLSELGILNVEIDDTYIPPHITPPDDNTTEDDNDTSVNEPPKADASLSETKGTVDIPISIDASKSNDADGIITGYRWDFTSDGIYDTNWLNTPKTTYTYKTEGTFKVTLQVKDNNDSTDIDQINISISKKINNQPTKPIITGKNTGKQDTKIYFTVISTDPDNDNLQYNISWGDSQKTSSEFIQSKSIANISHVWNNAGIYTIEIYASDNKTKSETTSYTILIDACYVKIIGYLLDTNSNGVYDIFHYNNTNINSKTKRTENGYLLDYNNDSQWDHIYNPATDILSSYKEEKTTEKTPGFEIILIIIALALFLIFKRKKHI